MVCRPTDTRCSITGTGPRSRPSMKSVPGGFEVTEIEPCAAAGAVGGGAGAGAACRRLSGTRLDAGGAGCTTGGGAGAEPRGGGAGGGGGSLFWPSARYPPTPAATTTSAPTTIPTLERFFFPAGIFIPARGMGVVGALVTSVGASATAAPPGRRGGGGRRWLLDAPPAFGVATGCSGHTAVANSSIVANRWAGSLDREREIAAVRNCGASLRLAPALGTSSKMCL